MEDSQKDADTEITHALFSMPLLIKSLRIFEDNMEYERQNQNKKTPEKQNKTK